MPRQWSQLCIVTSALKISQAKASRVQSPSPQFMLTIVGHLRKKFLQGYRRLHLTPLLIALSPGARSSAVYRSFHSRNVTVSLLLVCDTYNKSGIALYCLVVVIWRGFIVLDDKPFRLLVFPMQVHPPWIPVDQHYPEVQRAKARRPRVGAGEFWRRRISAVVYWGDGVSGRVRDVGRTLDNEFWVEVRGWREGWMIRAGPVTQRMGDRLVDDVVNDVCDQAWSQDKDRDLRVIDGGGA
ncbi:hypothetical protein R3P38DRAFT_2779759 [Favolaschia claudopus]|uniref:Uncharacterized protein n=1 Tax=Favolaschia claudopus TaxID=2862362 RepID=A0AAW0BB97_9AGAR